MQQHSESAGTEKAYLKLFCLETDHPLPQKLNQVRMYACSFFMYSPAISRSCTYNSFYSCVPYVSTDSSSAGEPVSASVIVSADISDLTFSANFAQVMGDAG